VVERKVMFQTTAISILVEIWDKTIYGIETLIGSLKGIKVRIDSEEKLDAKHMIASYIRPFIEVHFKRYIKAVTIFV